ncbi:MAG: hypothetical protein GQ564_18240 [Bacteroidales bacterium]|nr:hypothetical protein [Bacteroidales bacterium]
MKTFKIFLLVITMIVMCGCPEEGPDYDGLLEIINNSENEIVWSFHSNRIESDTSVLSESFPWSNINDFMILPGETFRQKLNSDGFVHIFKNGWFQYYLYSYDSVMIIPWERIRDENIILKKVYFEIWEDLEACDFTITYP